MPVGNIVIAQYPFLSISLRNYLRSLTYHWYYSIILFPVLLAWIYCAKPSRANRMINNIRYNIVIFSPHSCACFLRIISLCQVCLHTLVTQAQTIHERSSKWISNGIHFGVLKMARPIYARLFSLLTLLQL